MYKITKYPYESRQKHFWSTDWHNYHDPKWPSPIWEMRGYLNAQDALENTLRVVNERVGENDILWYLGDGFLNASDDQVLDWLGRVKCKNIKYLFGNHESCPYRLYKQEVNRQFGRDDIEVYPLKLGNVEFLGNHTEIQIGKKHIVMNHFPLRIWNKNQHGSWMLSGHSHLNDPERRPESPIGKALDCGWDYKNDVWSFDEIEDVMSTKNQVAIDHHFE
jgi:calcineurin-like phosphoesterase family protein